MQRLKRLRLASWVALLACTLGACEGEDHRVGSAAPDGDDATARGGTTPGGTGNNGSGGTIAGSGVTSGSAGIGGTIAGGMTSGNGGGGGTMAGSGGTTALPECTGTMNAVATGCIVDELDSLDIPELSPNAPTAVTVTALDRGDPIPSLCGLYDVTPRELVLSAADGREWRYFIELPGLPDDFVTTGDELDLFAYAYSKPTLFAPRIQTVVLARGSKLVVFTMNTGYQTQPLDLSAYGLAVAVGEPYCGTKPKCAFPGGAVEPVVRHSELVVTQGADTQRLRAGDTRQMTGVSISVQDISAMVGSSCSDPPDGVHRFGGFATSR